MCQSNSEGELEIQGRPLSSQVLSRMHPDTVKKEERPKNKGLTIGDVNCGHQAPPPTPLLAFHLPHKIKMHLCQSAAKRRTI